MLYMIAFGVTMGNLRRCLGSILAFIRDPDDLTFSLIRDLLEVPSVRIAQRRMPNSCFLVFSGGGGVEAGAQSGAAICERDGNFRAALLPVCFCADADRALGMLLCPGLFAVHDMTSHVCAL